MEKAEGGKLPGCGRRDGHTASCRKKFSVKTGQRDERKKG